MGSFFVSVCFEVLRLRQFHVRSPPTDPPELSEIYNFNWPSVRSYQYNRRCQYILRCRLVRVAGDTNRTLSSEAVVGVWNSLDCAVKINTVES